MSGQKWVLVKSLDDRTFCPVVYVPKIYLIKSFRLDIIGVRKIKNGKKDTTRSRTLNFLSREKQIVSEKRLRALSVSHADKKKTCHVLGMFSQAEQSHLLHACFFIRNLFFLFLLRLVPLLFDRFLFILKKIHLE